MPRKQGVNLTLEGDLKISLPSLGGILYPFLHWVYLTHYCFGLQGHTPYLSLWLSKWQTPVYLALGCIAAGP